MRRIVLALLLVISATPLFATDPIVLGPYQYDGAGNIRAIGTTESFLYDRDSRLVNAVMTPGTQTFKYDTFGNRTFADTTGITRCNGGAGCKREPDPGTLSRTNRIAGATYNAAGAVETMDGRVYTYEPAGMMTSQKNTQLVQYIYTAGDERIAVYTNGRWTWSLRDPGEHPIRQVTSDDAASAPASTHWTWAADEIFSAGSVLASERPLIGRRHFHLDHLGTPRLITTDTGAIAAQYEYYAFGTQPDDGSPREIPTEELKFTGHQRDMANGDVHVLDYMHARYYDGAMGRFTSLDPKNNAKPEDAQSWNRYVYALNNPLKFIDPNGQDVYIVVTNTAVGGTRVNSRPRHRGVDERVPKYKVVMMNEAGHVVDKFAVSRDSNYAGPTSQTRGEYGSDHEAPPGSYFGHTRDDGKLGPRVELSDAQNGSTITAPDGTVRQNIQIHVGPGCSEGCMLLTGGKENRDAFIEALQKQQEEERKAGRSDQIHVVIQPRNERECSDDRCEYIPR